MWKNIQFNIFRFGKDLNLINPKKDLRVQYMIREIKRMGGLNFKIEIHEDGWMATCQSINGIVAGNSNPNPTQEEIDTHIRGAIFSAFNIPSYLCDESLINFPTSASKKLIPAHV